MTSTTTFENDPFCVIRVQRNMVARHERRVLDGLCRSLPSRVQPDHLTILGVVGAVVTFIGYVGSRFAPDFLWIASLGLIVHWFGDSLDGSLARHRRIERPSYGYFLDHTVDAISNLIIMLGVGLSLYVRMDVALFALVGYYLLCIYVFINNHLNGVLQLSFCGWGPTELRLGLVGINAGMYFAGDVGIKVGSGSVSIYDGALLVAGSIFVVIFVIRMLAGIRDLRAATVDPRTSQHGAFAPAQSRSRNASSFAK